MGQHGSWNRKRKNGYRVMFVPFENGKPKGMPIVVLKGFLAPDGRSYGRPIGVIVDKQGGLLVADDQRNRVWRLRIRNRHDPPRGTRTF
mgnify:CR=1 FL=1